MARSGSKKRSKMNKDLILIILLCITIFVLILYILFSKIDSKDDTIRKNFLSKISLAQSELSYYLGGMEKDTFGLYSKIEILSGKTNVDKSSKDDDNNDENTEDTASQDANQDDGYIKDNEGNNITGIIDISKNYGTDEKTIYKINTIDLEKVLNVSLQEIEGLEWYIENGSIIKVKFQFSKPDWWNDNFDVFVID